MPHPPLHLIAAAVALALAAALAAGCGGDDDSGDGGGPVLTESDAALLTSEGFGSALDAVSESAGDDASVLQVQLSERGAVFRLTDGGEPASLLYTAGGEVVEQELEVLGAELAPEDEFSLSDVDPAAVDLIAEGVEAEAGAGTELTGLSLEFDEAAGELDWTVSTRAEDGSAQVFTAPLDGGEVAPAAEERG